MKKKTKVLVRFLAKIDNEDFLYAVENYSDDIRDIDHAVADNVGNIIHYVESLKSRLIQMVDEAKESGELNEDDIPFCVDQF